MLYLLETKLTRSDVRFSSSLDHIQLTLKRSKTDRRHEGIQIVLAKTGNEAYPVDALQKLLRLDPKEPDAPLFSFHRKPFSRNHFLSTLSTKLRALGIQTDGYSGHSFRKGAAQHTHDRGSLTTRSRCSRDRPQRHSGRISPRTRQFCTCSITSSRQAHQRRYLYCFLHRPSTILVWPGPFRPSLTLQSNAFTHKPVATVRPGRAKLYTFMFPS